MGMFEFMANAYDSVQEEMSGLMDTIRNADKKSFEYIQDLVSDARQLAGSERFVEDRPDTTFLDPFLEPELDMMTDSVTGEPIVDGMEIAQEEQVTEEIVQEEETVAEEKPTEAELPEAELVSNTPQYGSLWGSSYHTKAEDDATKQKDYDNDVKKYVKSDTSYYKDVSPILERVVSAFDGDEGIKKDKLYRAMLEIGAHESEGGTQLVNSNSSARGVFQVLVGTARENMNHAYMGPKARRLMSKTAAEVEAMTDDQVKEWMRTSTQDNAVLGTIELMKLSKDKGTISSLR